MTVKMFKISDGPLVVAQHIEGNRYLYPTAVFRDEEEYKLSGFLDLADRDAEYTFDDIRWTCSPSADVLAAYESQIGRYADVQEEE